MKLPTRFGKLHQIGAWRPEVIAGDRVIVTDLFQYLVQAQRVGVVHRATAIDWPAIAVDIDHVDVAGAYCNTLVKDFCTFIDFVVAPNSP